MEHPSDQRVPWQRLVRSEQLLRGQAEVQLTTEPPAEIAALMEDVSQAGKLLE